MQAGRKLAKQKYIREQFKTICFFALALPLLWLNFVFLLTNSLAQNTEQSKNTEQNSSATKLAALPLPIGATKEKENNTPVDVNSEEYKKQQRIENSLKKYALMQAEGPIGWVSSLLILQDDIAAGLPGAIQLQAILIKDIGQKISSADISTWSETENTYALLVYLFNGGNPYIVENILRKIPEGVIPQQMKKGAYAYAHKRQSAFLQTFPDLDTLEKKAPIALKISIALNTASGLIEINPAEADKRLDFVRLTAPGSLFEEAALRRQIKAVIKAGHYDKLSLLVRNYVERFSSSAYANEFWREYSVEIPKIEYQLSDFDLQKLVSFAPNIVQFIIYMQTGRNALLDARMTRSHFSADKALQLAKVLKIDDSAAKLYFAASFVGSISAQKANDVLLTIDSKKLPKRDQVLLLAAQSIAQAVLRNSKDWPFPIIDETDKKDPMAMLKKLPIETDTLPLSSQSETLNPAETLSIKRQAENFSDKIDEYMEEAQQKIQNIDKLLEIKQ